MITDIDMAGGNGFELIRRIRKADSIDHRHTPVVVMSSLADDEIEGLSQRIGADSFLSKPLNKSRVHELIEQLMQSNTRESHGHPYRGEDVAADAHSNRRGASETNDSSSPTSAPRAIDRWATPTETATRWSSELPSRISPVLRRIYQSAIHDPDVKSR